MTARIEPRVHADIILERDKQIAKGYTREADDMLGIVDWMSYIRGEQKIGMNMYLDRHGARAQLVKIAALAIAGIESIDRVTA
jgi:hypothetical protein